MFNFSNALKKGLYIIPFLLLSITLKGAYLEKIPTTVTNPDGTKIECYASGDEYFNYLHDADGFTIIKGKDGYYYYGIEEGDIVVPSPFKVNSIAPKAAGLKPHAKISEKEYKRRVEARWSTIKDDASKAPHTGDMNNLVIYIRFNDDAEFTTQRSVFDGRLNSTSSASLKHYFQEVSYGQLDITSYHYPIADLSTNLSYQDSYDRSYFQPYNATTNTNGYSGDDERRTREHALLQRAVNALENQIPNSLTIDADNDNRVDNVCFIIRGNAEGWSDLLWAHRWVLYSYNVTIHGKRVWDYTFQPENQAVASTISHEMFHTLGAPDLYRYSHDGFTPVGPWDLMSSGFVHMGAFMKYKYANGNWISEIPTISEPGEYTLNPLTSSENNAYRINSPFSSTEYFIVEYRKQSGIYESNIPRSGLLVYRINQLAGDGNAQGPPDEVYLYRPNGTTTSNGSLNLAALSSDYGYTAIGDNLNPEPFLSDGSQGGLNIINIGSVGETITFTLSNTSVYNVNLSVNPSNSGLAWDETNAEPYEEGDEVTVKAQPFFGYEFANWTNGNGDIQSTSSTYTFYMPENDIELIANFVEKESYNVNFFVKNQYDNFVENATIAIAPADKQVAYEQFINSYTTNLVENHAYQNPNKLVLSKSSSKKTLDYSNTSKEVEGNWIHWDNGENTSSIGTNGESNFKIASKWEAADLTAYSGQFLSKISFFPREVNATYTIKIWLGPNAVEVYSQEVSNPNINEWNTIILDVPFQLSASYDLWFGVEIDAQTGYPAGCDSGPAVSGKGNMIYWNDSWVQLSDLNQELTGNWNLQAFVSDFILKSTNNEGYTTIKLTPGNYSYSISKYNYDPFEGLFQIVNEDVNIYPVITRGATYSVTFEITDENESPIENATIVFNGTDYFSDAEGVVVINDLDPMIYQYSVFKEGYVQDNGEIEIIDNNVDVSIVLPVIPTYTVTFTITSSQGLVEGANIAFADNNYTTNSEGIAVITGVYSGIYSYSVTKDNYHERTGQLTVENTDKSETISLTPVSVEGLLDKKLKIYPNPFTNQLTIDGIKNVERIVISNIVGQKVHEVNNSNDSHKINTSQLKKGIHLVTLHYNDGSRITRKLIKQ